MATHSKIIMFTENINCNVMKIGYSLNNSLNT